jgi:hypothetical protein
MSSYLHDGMRVLVSYKRIHGIDKNNLFHHEGHEGHEETVKALFNRCLRVLRVLRGTKFILVPVSPG